MFANVNRLSTGQNVGVILLGLFYFLFPSVTHAALVYEQSASSSLVAAGLSGIGWSWNPGATYTFNVMDTINDGGGSATSTINIKCYTDGSLVSQCPSGEWPTAGYESSTFTNNSVPDIHPSRYYFAQSLTVNGSRTYTFTAANHPALTMAWWGTTTPDVCYTGGCTGTPYYALYDSDPGPVEDDDDSTHIITMLPVAGSTTTSPVTVGMDSWINEDDVGNWLYQTKVVVRIGELGTPFDPETTALLNVVATTSGYMRYHSSQSLSNGSYYIQTTILRTYLNGWISGLEIDKQVNIFTIGQATFAGNLYGNLVDDLNGYISGAPATTTTAVAKSCNPISGQFSIIECTYFLLLPNPTYSSDLVSGIKEDIAYKVPWGYATRFYDLVSGVSTTTASTSTLPSLVITLPTGYPGAGGTFDLTPWDKLLGTGSMLATTQSAGSNPKTIRQMVEPGWTNFVYLSFLIMIVTKLIGLSGFATQTEITNARVSAYADRRRRT